MPFSLKDLEQLSQYKNHTIKFDGYDYWWYSKIDNKWSLHCIKPFKSYQQGLEYIKYWLVKYAQEVINNEAIFERITDNVIKDVNIYEIANSNLKPLNKVIKILEIRPNLNQTEISEYLNITKMAVSKHFKKLKYVR
ncbi:MULTISPECIES: HTH domain-containing protein [Flavobacterium]|uniref:HTH domain-containing protein n=1 Tax=Flavobacterium keumense TaxID=1306518 RepID=A0ABY8N3N0_9FLAO|nr:MULTISPECIES: HTH domain-containing protein [Flavobacterium]WGK94260.1 HTH domain-containing protein [Flavobacterium keumense]